MASRKRPGDDMPSGGGTDGDSAAAPSSSTGSPNNHGPSPSKKSRSSSAASRPPTRRLRVKIKRFHGVARWTWNVGGSANVTASGEEHEEDVCGICQSPYEGVAPGMKYPGDDCPIERGPCGHAFHLQCVNRWLQNRNTCPICRADWGS